MPARRQCLGELCGPTWNLAHLQVGDHVAEVRAIDRAGTPDPTPVRIAFTVDYGTPSVTLRPSVPGTGPASVGIDTFEPGLDSSCRLDLGDMDPVRPTWTHPNPPRGRHTLTVRVIDAWGNIGTNAVSWTRRAGPSRPRAHADGHRDADADGHRDSDTHATPTATPTPTPTPTATPTPTPSRRPPRPQHLRPPHGGADVHAHPDRRRRPRRPRPRQRPHRRPRPPRRRRRRSPRPRQRPRRRPRRPRSRPRRTRPRHPARLDAHPDPDAHSDPDAEPHFDPDSHAVAGPDRLPGPVARPFHAAGAGARSDRTRTRTPGRAAPVLGRHRLRGRAQGKPGGRSRCGSPRPRAGRLEVRVLDRRGRTLARGTRRVHRRAAADAHAQAGPARRPGDRQRALGAQDRACADAEAGTVTPCSTTTSARC